jgi:hypothetical protein
MRVLLALLLAVSTFIIGCGSSAPIMLRPTLPNARIGCPVPAHAVHLSAVLDRRGYEDAANVGFTQTGWTNVKASLRTQPAPKELVQQRVENVLRACSKPAPGTSAVDLEVLITRFQTTETTGFASESIEAEIALQVRLKSAAGDALGTFDVSAKAEDSGLDTTGAAEGVIRTALIDAEKQLARALAARARALPTEAPSSTGEVAPATTVQTAPPTPMAQRVRASARRMSAEDEDDQFDERLQSADLVPVRIEVVLTVQGAPISIRRDGVRVAFADRASATAVDTRKVQEMVRTSSGALAGAAFGAAGAAAAGGAIGADNAASEQVGEAAFDVAVLKKVGAKLSGLVFFSRRHGSAGVPTTLSIELVDGMGHPERLLVQLP